MHGEGKQYVLNQAHNSKQWPPMSEFVFVDDRWAHCPLRIKVSSQVSRSVLARL